MARLQSKPLLTERLCDGRRKVMRDLVVTAGGTQVTVPQETVTDFSTIPWFGRWMIDWSKVDIAGVVHDHLYQSGKMSRQRADRMWRLIATSGQHRAASWQGWVCWIALRFFGWWVWNQYRREMTP